MGMKATAESLTAASVSDKSCLAVFAELIKPRLTFLVVVTTLVGFYVGFQGEMDYALMLHAVLGTALVAGGAAALNQFMERELDARMRRTEGRPLPSGRMHPDTALIFGGASSVAGLVYLALVVNQITSLLGVISLASYLFVYTPLKRITTLNTAIGAVPGALPPLMGWTAARGDSSPKCSSLSTPRYPRQPGNIPPSASPRAWRNSSAVASPSANASALSIRRL